MILLLNLPSEFSQLTELQQVESRGEGDCSSLQLL